MASPIASTAAAAAADLIKRLRFSSSEPPFLDPLQDPQSVASYRGCKQHTEAAINRQDASKKQVETLPGFV